MSKSVPAKRTLDQPTEHLKCKTVRLGGHGACTHAPAFTKTAVVDGSFSPRSLSANLSQGKWTVLTFIPPAFSFTFAVPPAVGDAFAARQAEVYYVSTDSEYVLRAWAGQSPSLSHRTVFLSDPNFSLSKSFGVLQPNKGLPLPSTFLIDPQGVVQHADLSEKPIQTNFEETLRLLDAFQFTAQHGDQVCPANWIKGAETISTSNPAVYFQAH